MGFLSVLGVFLKPLFGALFEGLFGWLAQRDRDALAKEAGAGAAVSGVLIESSRLERERRDAEEAASRLTDDELMRQLHDLGQGDVAGSVPAVAGSGGH